MSNYRWATTGDINAFFGLMLDNVTVMVLLVGLITSATPAFTPEFVLTRMVPGTALGVLFGDLVYTWLAFRLARKTGRNDVTAMPLGLDTPSTFGIAFLVLLPALQQGVQKFPQDHQRAMEFAWHVGLVVLILSGIFKILCAPVGNWIRRIVPRAGLLGSLAAIALVLIAFLPMVIDGIAGVPLVGMLALGVILWSLVAHRALPGHFPGALGAVLLGVVVYQLCAGADWLLDSHLVPAMPPRLAWDWEPGALLSFYGNDSEWWREVVLAGLQKLPVALPFALATIVGGIDCTESAAAAGDDYDTRGILMTEGVASLLAGLLGGVIQTTPYIGHPAYKKMGGRAAYTLATALFIGTVGYFGGFTVVFAYLPKAALFPILVFVGVEITAQSFQATPDRHYPALALAMLPALAYLLKVFLESNVDPSAVREEVRMQIQTIRCLANGFLISSLLWASALALLLDGKTRWSSLCFALAGVLALVGIIHSPLPAEQIALPHQVLPQVETNFQQAVQTQTPYHWAATYGLLALLFLLLGRFGPKENQPPEQEA